MTAVAATPTDNLVAALAYARRGWRVIPIPPGSKHPAIAAWQREGTTDETRIRHWWTQAPHHGIGIVTGPASGIWVLDVDVSDGKAGDDTLAELEEAYGPLPDTYEVITGSGGRHIYFTCRPGDNIRNNQSGRIGAGLDVRGEGGQVLAPPTIHPNGRPYVVEAGATDDVVDAPGWLLALLTPEEPDHERTSPAPTRTDRPGDQWAAATSWDELLTADGWVKLRPGPDGEDRWTRPGKDAREGPSATVGYKGSDVLKVFTSSVPELRADETYTKLGYEAAMRHGGDHAAAARWCRQQGYGEGHGDARDLVGAAHASPAPSPEPWLEPAPIPEPAPPAPFPISSLPVWAQEHAVAAADQVQVPVDLTAMLVIGALSAVATGRANVHVSPNWSEPTNLYLVTAMRSGAGKSPAEKLCVDWLKTWQRERVAQAMPAWEEANQRAKLAEKRHAALERNSLGDNFGEVFTAKTEAVRLREEVPRLPYLLADDATPEAVTGMLKDNDERLAIMSTEADLFDMVLKGKPGQRANLNVYLKAWSGDSLTRNRKGGQEVGPERTELTHPLMTVAVTVQPAVLARVQADDEMVSRGFAARFMFSLPPDMIGRRDQRRRFRGDKLSTLTAYSAAATALAERWGRWASPADLRYTAAAADALEDFLVEIEPQLAEGGPLARLGEWANKLHGSIVRYSGILHLADDHRSDEPISADTVARAVDLGRYWLSHAAAVLGLQEDEVVVQARAIFGKMLEKGRSSFTIADAQGECRRPGIGLDRAADFVPAIEFLIDLGWIRPTDRADWKVTVGVKGSKKEVFEIAPSAVGSSLSVWEPREPRTASMGESFSLLIPPVYSLPSDHAVRGSRGSPEPPTPDLDPLDWSALADAADRGQSNR